MSSALAAKFDKHLQLYICVAAACCLFLAEPSQLAGPTQVQDTSIMRSDSSPVLEGSEIRICTELVRICSCAAVLGSKAAQQRRALNAGHADQHYLTALC